MQLRSAAGVRPARPPGRGHRWPLLVLALLVAIGGSVVVHALLQREQLAYRLLRDLPEAAGRDPTLTRFAAALARPVFAERCAACHGADMRGKPAVGAPDLTDGVWLWGNGSVHDIERTILYGVRAGISKTRDVDDMPAFGLKGTFVYQGVPGFKGRVVGGAALDSGQVWDLVQYLLKINHRRYQSEAASIGERLSHQGSTSCRDCHAPDLEGVSGYGAPDLTINVWNNGGTSQDLYDSIYFGRQRMMLAWQGVLTLEQIRALAVYIHSVSHEKGRPGPASTSATFGQGEQ
ncbi:MAG: c-type cytochrome [Steroidobacteraceae bacterium]